ncbi:MAG: hypothetical protein FD122_3505 [Stygiobacter sp.]|jgi:hypothetical protein|nr:MAG: hypothetical protein FD122_3505 [Stygiobacter sp.]
MVNTTKSKPAKKHSDQETEEKYPDERYSVQLRLLGTTLKEIDEIIKKRRVKPSRHMWLEEAIFEKLDREKKKLDAGKIL